MNKYGIYRGMGLFLAALVLGGCSLVNRQEPLQPVMLKSYQSAAPICKSRLAAQIMVSMPQAPAALYTDRIAILTDGRLIHYAQDYKWEDAAPAVIQRQLVDLLNTSGCFTGAGTGSMALRADYRLEVDIKELFLVYDQGKNGPLARVGLLLRLVDIKSGNLVGQYKAGAEKSAGKDDVYTAMESAIHAAGLDSLNWLRAVASGKAGAN